MTGAVVGTVVTTGGRVVVVAFGAVVVVAFGAVVVVAFGAVVVVAFGAVVVVALGAVVVATPPTVAGGDDGPKSERKRAAAFGKCDSMW